MTKARSLALVCSGPISRTGLVRLPNLAARLGPVKSTSLQSASRAVNLIGGGNAVTFYRELNASRTVLLNVPDDRLSTIVAELAVNLVCKNKIIILSNSSLDSSQLNRLESQGAAIGSFAEVPGSEGKRFVMEGSRTAVREMRMLLEQGGVRAFEIRRGAKTQYLTGTAFATTLLTSMIVAAVKSFRDAGMPLKEAHGLAAKLAEKALKDYLKTGVGGSPAMPGVDLQALATGLELANPGLMPLLSFPKP